MIAVRSSHSSPATALALAERVRSGDSAGFREPGLLKRVAAGRLAVLLLFALDDAFDCAPAAAAAGSCAARLGDRSRGSRSAANRLSNRPIVHGLAVADNHGEGLFTEQCSLLKVTFNIELCVRSHAGIGQHPAEPRDLRGLRP